MEKTELDKRFTYHAPKNYSQAEIYVNVRLKAKELAEFINRTIPECREQSLAFTALEEAVMWANAAVARRTPND